jgi:hypothetical protein
MPEALPADPTKVCECGHRGGLHVGGTRLAPQVVCCAPECKCRAWRPRPAELIETVDGRPS